MVIKSVGSSSFNSTFSFLAYELMLSTINKSAFFSSLLITAKRSEEIEQREAPLAGDEQIYVKFDVQK